MCTTVSITPGNTQNTHTSYNVQTNLALFLNISKHSILGHEGVPNSAVSVVGNLWLIPHLFTQTSGQSQWVMLVKFHFLEIGWGRCEPFWVNETTGRSWGFWKEQSVTPPSPLPYGCEQGCILCRVPLYVF